MKTIRLFLVVAGVTGGLGGCGLGPERDDFAESRARWRDRGFTSYTYRVDRSCFCGAAGPAHIEVRDGVVVAVTDLRDDTSVPAEFLEFYDTVEDLFDTIQNAIDRNAERLEVTYDAELGFPTSIVLDFAANVADDELWVEVSRMEGTS